MASFKLLALTFTILYFFTFSTARISIPLNVQPKNVVINRDNVATASGRVYKPSPRKTMFLPTLLDHEPSDQVLGVELEPEIFDQHNKHDEQKPSNLNTIELTKFNNNNDLNDDLKALDEFTIDLEMERPNHMKRSKNKLPGVSDQDILIREPHESDQDFPIKELHESDLELPVKEHESQKNIPALSENTISIETLHLNPSSYFRIRPINRHFRVRPSLFRIHKCRHQHMNNAHQNSRQVPQGNDMILTRDDMILAGQTKEQFDPSKLHISTHSDPEKRPMTHHHDEDKNMMMRRPFRQYIARQKLKKKVEEEIQKRKEMDAKKQGGFMKSFRKFLNQF